MLTRVHRFEDPDILKDFIRAGKAIITLESRKTGDYYTFKIKKSAAVAGAYYVSRLSNGVDEKWVYLGMIDENGFRSTHKTTADARMSKQFNVFLWFWTCLNVLGGIHSQLDVYHDGLCGACGNRLTTPESIEAGYGPECLRRRRSLGLTRNHTPHASL